MTILRRGNRSSLNKKKLVLLIELSRLRIEFFSLPFHYSDRERISSERPSHNEIKNRCFLGRVEHGLALCHSYK